MRLTDIENWALKIIEAVEAKQPVEDSRVELKREFIPSDKAARRLAGHANSAHGEQILWLIGIDEIEGVVGVNYAELGTWLAGVEARYDEIAPRATPVNINRNGRTVVALLWDTDRAPYVVSNPDGGTIGHEVPWRDGTRTRSAKRSELLRILVPLQKLPRIEMRQAKISIHKHSARDPYYSASASMYFASVLDTPIVFPFHHCQAYLEIEGVLARSELGGFALHRQSSQTMDATGSELIIHGPGEFQYSGSISRNHIEQLTDSPAVLTIVLSPIDFDAPIVIEATCQRKTLDSRRPNSLVAEWAFDANR